MATDLRRHHAALDAGSFERFYRSHLGEIYRYVLRDVGNRADAEEVTQTAFLDAYRALRRGHEPEQPRAWMYGIARNAARRRYRTQSRRPREVELEAELADRLVEAEQTQRLAGIRAALESLQPSHRHVIFLREVEGLSYTEIASRMRLSLAAVETLLFRARRSLRTLLEAEGFRPAVRAGRARRLGGLVVVPTFFSRLSDRVQQLFATELTAKAAGAATAVALGVGVAAGTYTLPLDAKASRDAGSRPPSLLAARAAPAASDGLAESSSSGATEGGGGTSNDAGSVGGGGQAEAAGPQGPAWSGVDGAVAGTISAPSVSVPGLETPDVLLPEVSTPEISTPAVEVPSVSVDPEVVPDVVVQVPDVEVQVPDVEVQVPDIEVDEPDVPVDTAEVTGGLPDG